MKIIACFDNDMWCNIDGTSICIITDEDYNNLESGKITTGDLIPVGEICLKDFSLKQPWLFQVRD